MNKRHLKSAALFLLIASLSLGVAGAVSASESRTWSDMNCRITVTSTCNESVSDTGVFAGGVVASSKTLGEGVIGGYAELYTDDGDRVKKTGIATNDAGIRSINFVTSAYDVSGSYYGVAYSRCHNPSLDQPSFYWPGPETADLTYTTNSRSAVEETINLSKMKPIKMNENGEAYGCMPASVAQGIELDLISAIGNNGVKGYIRAEDELEPEFSSLEEAKAYRAVDHVIPLYAADGVTVVDTFTIEAPIIVSCE